MYRYPPDRCSRALEIHGEGTLEQIQAQTFKRLFGFRIENPTVGKRGSNVTDWKRFDHRSTADAVVEGVDLDELASRLGVDARERYARAIQEHVRAGLLLVEGSRLRLTPLGLDLTSFVLRSFLPDA